MKTRPSNFSLCLAVLGLASFVLGPPAFSQTPATLGVQIVGGYARLNIAGDVGSAWTIQYTSTLGPPPTWQTLTNLTLSISPTVVTDSTAAVAGRRFYRAVSQ